MTSEGVNPGTRLHPPLTPGPICAVVTRASLQLRTLIELLPSSCLHVLVPTMLLPDPPGL